MNTDERLWWASLKHGGLLIAPSRLLEYFPDDPKPLPPYLSDQLRRDLTRLDLGTAEVERAWLDTVLEQVCGLGARWEKGNQVDARWSHRALTGEIIKPRRLWYGAHATCLPVFATDDSRLGVGRGRRMVSRVVEWLRGTGEKLALLTNHRQFRLIYAGLDHDAFVEWDTALWFEEGRPGPQVTALTALLSPHALEPEQPDAYPRLLAAIKASRRGQAELSAALGERVRQAVELLIQTHGSAFEPLGPEVHTRHIYLAATRMIMRLVVILFAEARDLLPRDNPVYHASYGLQGLREMLERGAGGAGLERLRHRYGAWARILALFRLVYDGCHHEALPVRRYGGDLFARGSREAKDPVQRALTVLEEVGGDHAPTDGVIHQILRLLCRSRVKVRQGRGSTWIEAPVDFSDLSSEYIGILYEGLLDYELRRAQEPVVFLALGDEPALPLARLEAMDDAALGKLVEKFKVKRKLAVSEDEEEKTEEQDDAPEDETDETAEEPGPELPEPEQTVEGQAGHDAHHLIREKAIAWARRAVIAGKLVPKPRARSQEAQHAYEQAMSQMAECLVTKTILPGEWFLVRWGGTRKGAGTFYTRPQLAVPTVQRTLRPLAYDPPAGSDGHASEDAPASAWTPKRPEQILTLKVCDPAVGSGSFLVASLRFLTEALFASLHHHSRIRGHVDQALVTLAEGHPSTGRLTEELLPCRPDADDFEPRLRARLKRYVVERCLYGVDLDPLAVELAKLSLWIETMDKDLPFEFLDDKLKVGNSLVGCWFDRFRDYPALAWDREGGDKNHSNGVHFLKDAWTKAIKQFRNGRIKSELMAWITGQRSLLDEIEGRSPETIHDEAVAVLQRMAELPVHEPEARAAYYREHMANNSTLARLKDAFSAWCAIWFWPLDQLDHAPTPRTFENPSEAIRTIVTRLHEHYRFFHWELEFPDVFAAPGGGFDGIVGNPPWEIQKPNSKEYFSNLDPLYRAYGKQEALTRQKELFQASKADERAWLDYCADFKALANFGKHAASPFGDGADGGETFSFGRGNDGLHAIWKNNRAGRGGYADPKHPYRYQGSADINTYKRFLEQSHALLRPGGWLGMLAPSGVYTDKGSTDLRALFLTHCRWRWLFGFENREGIFDIHRSFKFGPVIVQKGGTTDRIQTAFMRRNLADWEEGETYAIPYARAQVERFSPRTKAILEIRSQRDLQILEKIYGNSVLLGDDGPDGWGIQYAREFDMTNDSKLFPPRPAWEEKGYRPDQYGRWIGPDGDIALPLYEGRMIAQFDFSQKGWVSGKGRGAVWREIPWEAKVIEPQYLIAVTDRNRVRLEKYLDALKRAEGEEAAEAEAARLKDPNEYARWAFPFRRKTAFMDVTSATNERTMIASVLDDYPAGNSAPLLYSTKPCALLCGILNSYVYDYTARARCGGLHLNYFVIEETPLPRSLLKSELVLRLSLRLCAPTSALAVLWVTRGVYGTRHSWNRLWALTPHERLRLSCLLDALVAELYGLNWEDLSWILRDCDHPVERLRDNAFTRALDPKGFWRVDKEQEPELRHTVLTLAAFRDLKDMITACDGDREKGIEAFCTQHDGDGWMLPETLTLDANGLGHDRRAKEPQPVRSRLGDRFLPWQLDQSFEDSWKECELHARNILGEAGFAEIQAELRGEGSATGTSLRASAVAEAAATYQAGNLELFGETTKSVKSRVQRKGK